MRYEPDDESWHDAAIHDVIDTFVRSTGLLHVRLSLRMEWQMPFVCIAESGECPPSERTSGEGSPLRGMLADRKGRLLLSWYRFADQRDEELIDKASAASDAINGILDAIESIKAGGDKCGTGRLRERRNESTCSPAIVPRRTI